MTIHDFLEEAIKLNEDELEKYLADRIKVNYVSYTDKCGICDRILNASCYVEIDGRKTFKINSSARFMLFMVALIQEYTDIEFSDNIVADFEMLDRAGMIDAIVSFIPDGEYTTMENLLNMGLSDKMENERSIVTLLENSRDAIGLALATIGDLMEELSNGSVEREIR